MMNKLMLLIREALRKSGQLFPITDEEVERFIRSTNAKPLDEDFIKKITANILGDIARGKKEEDKERGEDDGN